MASLEYERQVASPVMGIDEAGRGPLAGCVVASAVSVPLDLAEELILGAWAGVDDSKRLSAKRRMALAETIKSTVGCTWAIECATPQEIDRLNILRATHLAMRRAALSVGSRLGLLPDEDLAKADQPSGLKPNILVDGLPVPTLPYPSINIVKGDAKSLLVAAASILAKTARDAQCEELAARYPGYGFEVHKGYPTKAHLEALRRLGPCPEHRMSFAPVRQMELFQKEV